MTRSNQIVEPDSGVMVVKQAWRRTVAKFLLSRERDLSKKSSSLVDCASVIHNNIAKV